MKKFLLSALIAFLSLGVVAESVEAKRLGGGGSSGFKRSTPTPSPSVPAKPAQAPGNAAPGAAAAAPAAAAATAKRSWMGPVAGLAAGLGLAALASHLGLGAELANFMTIALLLIVGVVVVRFLMRRFATPAARPMATPQGMNFSGGNPMSPSPSPSSSTGGTGGAWGGAAAAPAQPAWPAAAAATSTGPQLPAGFDADAFVRVAKLIFIRMQAANDAGNLEDLRQFSTPEMFAVFRLDLQDRASAPQRTDVVRLDAEVVDYAEERDQYVVSVRFHGLIREETGGVAAPFDEVWHLVKPADGSREWAIAGIAQSGTAS